VKNGLLRIAVEGMCEHKGGWIGFDLDSTLAYYDGWKGIEHIGEPIMEMVMRPKNYLDNGIVVKIFTARCAQATDRESQEAVRHIKAWCMKYIGIELEVTNVKDHGMIKLYDDRAVTVVENTGKVIEA
jgi:hypothetical protein